MTAFTALLESPHSSLKERRQTEVMDKNMQRMEVLLSDSNSPGFQLMEWLEVIYFAIILAGGLALVLFHDFPGWECCGLLWLLLVFIIGPAGIFAGVAFADILETFKRIFISLRFVQNDRNLPASLRLAAR